MNKTRNQTIDPARMLDAVPVRNRAATARQSGELLVLSVPLRRKWYMKKPLSLVLPFSRERVVSLDPLGRDVWNRCDGQATAEEIIDDFARRHHLRFHEARLSVMRFLRNLTERGLVVMVGPGEKPQAPQDEGDAQA